jgi:AcrR family transcriptional regulator
MTAQPTPTARPRVVGDREVEIFAAALEILRDVGYDRLTFDAVATAAKASKATLYRRWPHKRDLVIDAIGLFLDCPADQDPHTGTLRGDLLAQACAAGGLNDDEVVGTWGALLPVVGRDLELAEGLRARFVEPKRQAALRLFRNAQLRGEIGPDADLATLMMILPSMAFHEALLTGRLPGRTRIEVLVDTVVLPACRATFDAVADG